MHQKYIHKIFLNIIINWNSFFNLKKNKIKFYFKLILNLNNQKKK